MLIFLGILFIIGASRHYKKSKPNFYIQEHQKWERNEYMYNEYLKWCEYKGDIPMNKEIYLKDLTDKNKEINNLIK